MRIREIAIDNRPRERLLRYGIHSLSDAELLAIILQTGTRYENVIDLSNRLISKYGIKKLSQCSLKELQEIKGIGIAKACKIMAIFEIGKRQKIKVGLGKQIKSSKDVFDHVNGRLSEEDREFFMVLHLDTRNRVIRDEIISVGTLNSSLIHPREVFKSAIKDSTNAIILVHNHPSGDPEPSEEDREITKMLSMAGKLLSIKVLDHVIIGKGRWRSIIND